MLKNEKVKQNRRKRRSKLALLLILPLALFIFVIGWTLYWIGDSKPSKKQTKEPVEIVVSVPLEVAV